MNNTNTLLIHIGMPKTGTTALQNYLYNNSSKLEKYGWCYPVLEDGKIGYWGCKSAEKNGNGYQLHSDWIINGMKPKWDRGMEIALGYLEDKNVIISAENIYGIETNKFIADAKKKYDNIKVVVYLRRQDRAIESLYSQRIKSGLEYIPYYKPYNTFEEFIDSYVVSGNYLGYLSKLDSISQIIGKENLIVRIYEKQQLVGNNTITDFLSVLGISSYQLYSGENLITNLSLSGNYVEIKRIINSIQNVTNLLEGGNDTWNWSNWGVQTDFYNVCTRLSEEFNQDKREFGFFTIDKRREFLEGYTFDNEKIAREYLNREDGILFYDDRMDFPVTEMKQHNDFETDVIRVFTAMMYVQDQKFRKLLDEKSNTIIGNLLMKEALYRSKNRKLLFYGAGRNCQKLFDVVGNIPSASIADNDLMKQGTSLNGLRVSYAKDIADWQDYFVIVTCWKTKEIEEQLRGFGLKKEEDYILMREYGL